MNKKNTLHTSTVTVTPKLAIQWLKTNKKNRPTSGVTVTRYAIDIAANKWILTGDAIRFNGNGALIDGQHRLRAVIKANKSIPCLVIRNVPGAAFDVLDTGKNRNYRDTLVLYGAGNSHGFASAVAWAARLSLYPAMGVHVLRGGLSNRDVHEYWERHKDIENSEKFGKLARYVLGSEGMSAGLHYLFHLIDPALADTYMLALAEGESLNREHPAFHIRDRMIKNRVSKTKLPRKDVAAMIIKGWNVLRTGKGECARQAITWVGKGPSAENFPQIQ